MWNLRQLGEIRLFSLAPCSFSLSLPSGVGCHSILRNPCLSKHQLSSHCFPGGGMGMPSWCYKTPLCPSPPPPREACGKEHLIRFGLLSGFPPFSLGSRQPSSALDIEATETWFSNLVKLYWWFNIQPILLHAHRMTRMLDHKHFFFF